MATMTDAQRLSFEANGYIVIPNALSDSELADIRDAANRAEAAWRADTSLPGVRRENFQQIQAPIEFDDRIFDLLEHPTTFPIVRELVGGDVSMIDNDFIISPPHTKSFTNWHHDVGMPGVYHARSTMMVKLFFLLEDVAENGGCTLLLPGTHRFPANFDIPQVEDPNDMPSHVKMAYSAGTAYLFNGRCYHTATANDSDQSRRVLVFNYGHHWMKIWPGYEPSERLKLLAESPVRKQLLGMGPAYSTSL